MKKAINKDNYSQALKTFKQGDYDADMLIQKFDELRASMEDISEQSLSEIQDLITKAELPAELSEQLFSTITDPKTRIFIPPAKTESVATKETSEAHTDSHSSSLLDELLKWSKGDENKEIHVGQTIRGTYQLVSRIGKGGMGEVWKAIDLIQDAGDSKNKYVAIKFINHEIRSHPFALKALVREFARYKQLIHPNIVKAYELNRDESEVFIVMEYLEGISLKEFIKQHPDGISLNEAKPILGGISKALNYAHQEGIIHLDLKPGNVFYDPNTKKAKVIDFGIARLSKQSDRDKTRFDPGSLGAVSTSYASVEMLLDEDPDPRDDIYGLACVAYELISGKHAFNGAMATKAERDKMQPKPVIGLKKAEFQAILKGLNFDRNARTANAEQFFQDLYLPQLSAKRKRSRWLILAPILLLAIILTPLLMNKGYDIWKKNQIIEAISQNQYAGIEKFQALSVKKQLDMLLNEETLLSLVRFSIAQAAAGVDPIKFLHGFKAEIQTLVFKNHDVREILINYYMENINKALSADDFDQAIAYSINIIEKYPDSKNLSDQMEKVLSWKIEHLSKLENNYYQCIADNSKSLLELQPCLQATHKFIGRLAPQHAILVDPKLSDRYQKEISNALINGDLSQAEELLAHWRTLIKADTPQREELEHQLKYQRQVSRISEQVTGSSDEQMQAIINDLLELDTRTKTDILSQPVVKQKLMAYFNQNVSADIEMKKYTAAFKHVETAFTLFSDIKNQQQTLQQLNSKIIEYKNDYLEDLALNYQALLSSEVLDVKALQNLQRQIASIEPDNPLVNYPGVSEVFAKQIDQAISNEQFDLAHDYLESWKAVKPADSQSKELLGLSKKYQQQLHSYEKLIDIEKRIQEALQSEQLATVNTVINDLQNNFSDQQKQRVINKLQTQLVAFYQQQIQTAIQQDAFSLANDIADEALSLLPEEKSLLISKNQIEKEKTDRIDALLNDYQLALNSETADGKQIFSYLTVLQAIDSQYLEKNPQSYQTLKTHLMNLAKNEHALVRLQDITAHWEQFFNGKENSSKAREVYHESRNLIALRCLYTGRQLVQQGKQQSANEFLMFGLSLQPVISVQKALRKELDKTVTPAADNE